MTNSFYFFSPFIIVLVIFIFVAWGVWYNNTIRKKGELIKTILIENLENFFRISVKEAKFKYIRVFVDYSIKGFKIRNQKLSIKLIELDSKVSAAKEIVAHNSEDLINLDFNQFSYYTKGTEITKIKLKSNKEYRLEFNINPLNKSNIIKKIEIRGYTK